MKSMNATLALMLAALVASAAVADTHGQESAVDPAAVRTLKRMTDYLAGLEHFRVHTENTVEDLLDSGQRVDLHIAGDFIVRRPNRIRAERTGEPLDQIFYYDGASLTLYNPSDGVYATEKAPGTIEEVIDYAREDLGIALPVSDLTYRNAFAILMQGVTSAAVVGKATLGGVACDHLVFRRADVDFQVWVAAGDRPLPCKYVVTDTSTPEQVSTATTLSRWELSTAPTDATFVFAPAEGARAVSFLPVGRTD